MPRWVLVKVHFTVSPGSNLKVAVRLGTSPVLLASLQEIDVRSKFGVGLFSVEV
jgi:hypothetical protein